MKNRRRYSVARKPVSKDSRFSVILASVSAAALLFCIIASALSGGSGALYIGAVALASALLALYGCIVGIKELAAAKKEYKRSYVGAIFGGVIFVLWLAVFFTGVKV